MRQHHVSITRRHIVLSAMSGLCIGSFQSSVPASATGSQTSDPADAAVYYSELESRSRFSRLYDLMHPDAKRIIPEDVVVGWYENDFAPKGPGVVSVEEVSYGAWTWDVNGETYRDAAEVTYTQPFDDGSVSRDTIHLVERGGDWRWFFGPSREFVDEQIAIYGDSTSDEDDETETDRSGEREDDSSSTSGTVSVAQLEDARFRRSQLPPDMTIGALTSTSVGQGDGPLFGVLGDDLGANWLRADVDSSIPGAQIVLQYAVFERESQAERAYERGDIQGSNGWATLAAETIYFEEAASFPEGAIFWVRSGGTAPSSEPAPRIGGQHVQAGALSRAANVLVLTYVSVGAPMFSDSASSLDPGLALDPAYQLAVAAVEHVEQLAR